MKNAHERFGFAEFEKRLKDTTTRIRLTADCFIGEPANKSGASQGHLLSVFGTDVEVAALWAAVLGEERISVGGPGMMPYLVMFGERPGVYRGTLTLPGAVARFDIWSFSRPSFVPKETRPGLLSKEIRRLWFCGPPPTSTAFHCLQVGTSGSSPVSARLAGCGHCPG